MELLVGTRMYLKLGRDGQLGAGDDLPKAEKAELPDPGFEPLHIGRFGSSLQVHSEIDQGLHTRH
jgi:hypothetical protein